MGERLYSDEDVELVARAHVEWGRNPRPNGRTLVEAILDALASAGRLRPAGTLEVTESLRGQPDPGTAQDLAALAGYELGRSDERAELERAGRLLPDGARRERTVCVIGAEDPWIPYDLAQAALRDADAGRPIPDNWEIVERLVTGWRPVSSEDTGEARH